MSRERRLGLLLVLAGLLVALTVVAFVALRESRSLAYTIVFKDAQGLKAGDRVQLIGKDIGVVKWVELSDNPARILVRVKIDPQYARMVLMNSTAVIHGVTFPNVSGQCVVEVVNPTTQPPSPPLPKDWNVQGVSEVELQVWKLKGKLSGTGDALKQAIGTMADAARELGESVKDFASSPEVQDALTQLRAFMVKMQEQGRRAAAQLQQEWPKLRDKMKPVIQKLATTGRTYVAEELQAMMRQIEDTLKQWQKEKKE